MPLLLYIELTLLVHISHLFEQVVHEGLKVHVVLHSLSQHCFLPVANCPVDLTDDPTQLRVGKEWTQSQTLCQFFKSPLRYYHICLVKNQVVIVVVISPFLFFLMFLILRCIILLSVIFKRDSGLRLLTELIAVI